MSKMHFCQVVSEKWNILILFKLLSFFSCSVGCCKNHQLSDCTLSKQNTSVETLETLKIKQLYPTEDTISPEKLNLLCKYYSIINIVVSN